MTRLRVEIWCDGDCGTRYLATILHDDLNTITMLTRKLIEQAKADGWVEDGVSHFCLACVRQLRPPADMTVADAKRTGRLR